MKTLLRPGALLASMLALFLAGCAPWAQYLPGREPPRVSVVGVERLPGEGLEIRLAVKLRVQNVNDIALDFKGVSLELDVNGRPLATGVAAEEGAVPAYGEKLLTVPTSVSAPAMVRQMLGLIDGLPRGELPYALRGRLGGGALGSVRFASEGSLKLPP